MLKRGVFLVTGLPATGKTTLALALARALGAPLLAKDCVKEPLLEVLGASDPDASRRLSDASFAVLFALAGQQLQLGGPVVLEGNFRAGGHAPALRVLLERHGLEALAQILCRAPEVLRQRRLRERAADPDRHPGHRDATWVAAASPQDDGFLDIPGPRLVLDSATDPVDAAALIRSLGHRHLV